MAGTHNTRIYGWTPLPIISWEEASNWVKFQPELRTQNWKNWISTDLSVSDAAFAVIVKGDAMAPTFNEGTILVIEPAMAPNNRDFVVVAIKGQANAVFKQFLIDGDDTYLKSINNEYRTVQFDKSSTVVGTLVQARSDYRR